ncbi:hypothetical protein MMC27_002772 [Xylographa pallens]|nr:hypothetical protein [Xylographa pallens]
MTTGIDPNTWYRLTNAAIGASIALDVVNTGNSSTQGPVQLDGTGNVSGQFWHIVLQPTCKYHLSSSYLGPDMILSNALVLNRTTPYLKPIQKDPPDPSQQWTLIPVGNGEYKLTNDGVGPNLFMDFCGSPGGLCFGNEDVVGQKWALSELNAINPSNTLWALPSLIVSGYSLPALRDQKARLSSSSQAANPAISSFSTTSSPTSAPSSTTALRSTTAKTTSTPTVYSTPFVDPAVAAVSTTALYPVRPVSTSASAMAGSAGRAAGLEGGLGLLALVVVGMVGLVGRWW